MCGYDTGVIIPPKGGKPPVPEGEPVNPDGDPDDPGNSDDDPGKKRRKRKVKRHYYDVVAIEPPYQSEDDQPDDGDDIPRDSINVVLQQIEESEDESGSLHQRKTNIRNTVALKIDFGDFQATSRVRIWLLMYLAFNSNLVTISDGISDDLLISVRSDGYKADNEDVLSADTLFSGIGVNPAISKHNVPGDMQISMMGAISEHVNPYWDISALNDKINELSERLVYVWSISDDALRAAAIKRNQEIKQQLQELKSELTIKQAEHDRLQQSSNNSSSSSGGSTTKWSGRVYKYSGSNTTIHTFNVPDSDTNVTSQPSSNGKTWSGGWSGPGFPSLSR